MFWRACFRLKVALQDVWEAEKAVVVQKWQKEMSEDSQKEEENKNESF